MGLLERLLACATHSAVRPGGRPGLALILRLSTRGDHQHLGRVIKGRAPQQQAISVQAQDREPSRGQSREPRWVNPRPQVPATCVAGTRGQSTAPARKNGQSSDASTHTLGVRQMPHGLSNFFRMSSPAQGALEWRTCPGTPHYVGLTCAIPPRRPSAPRFSPKFLQHLSEIRAMRRFIVLRTMVKLQTASTAAWRPAPQCLGPLSSNERASPASANRRAQASPAMPATMMKIGNQCEPSTCSMDTRNLLSYLKEPGSSVKAYIALSPVTHSAIRKSRMPVAARDGAGVIQPVF